jgi:hypothetical protein
MLSFTPASSLPAVGRSDCGPGCSVVQACRFIQVVNVSETLNQEIDQAAHTG